MILNTLIKPKTKSRELMEELQYTHRDMKQFMEGKTEDEAVRKLIQISIYEEKAQNWKECRKHPTKI